MVMWLALWQSYVDYSEKALEFLCGRGIQAAILEEGLWDFILLQHFTWMGVCMVGWSCTCCVGFS